jgi:hypothetical protein
MLYSTPGLAPALLYQNFHATVTRVVTPVLEVTVHTDVTLDFSK